MIVTCLLTYLRYGDQWTPWRGQSGNSSIFELNGLIITGVFYTTFADSYYIMFLSFYNREKSYYAPAGREIPPGQFSYGFIWVEIEDPKCVFAYLEGYESSNQIKGLNITQAFQP